nr:enhancer of mRNA-decapping protein 4 [Leptinotarsa decemlineata]
MTSPHKGPKPNSVQDIKDKGENFEFSVDITGQTVIIHCKEGTHSHGSSKVKLTDWIDYNWEFRYYHGHLIAAHIGGKVVAYGMKVKDGGNVRVMNQETNQKVLIKNMKEDIKDVSFAFSRDDIILGCVDSEGNILVYQIDDTPKSMSFTLLLHVHHLDDNRISNNFRLIWCPYLPSFDDDTDTSDDPEKMFVVLNGTRAEVYNVTMLTDKYGKGGPIDPDETYDGYIEINHTSEVVDASFSADGTAIAIACADGYVKFFQLYMFNDEKQKCLHEWRPHDGAPLSSIIFIDNVLEYSSECWKFTITGANNNSEIKLWSCESWTCLQTIHFKPESSNLIMSLYLNMSIDYTGQYLTISDINNRVLYVLQLNRNDKEQVVQVTMLSQFLLKDPFLSCHILKAETRTVCSSYGNSNEDLSEDREDYDEESEGTAACLKMVVIQPKKLQHCNIIFQPKNLLYKNLPSPKSISSDKIDEKEKVPKLGDLHESVNLFIQQQSNSTVTLMTPDDFTPPGHRTRPSSVRNDSSVSLEKPANEIKEPPVENLIDFQRPQKDHFPSGGSSPSREVQEILSLNNSSYSNQDFFDSLPNMKEEQEEPQKDYSNQNSTTTYQENLVNELVWPKIPVVEEKDINAEDKSQMQALSFRLTALENIIQEQNTLLQKLHEERLDKNELLKEFDCGRSKQQLQIAKMLENLINLQKVRDREMQEHIVSAVGQLFTKSLSEKMQQIVSQEMHHVVLPAIHNMIESYRLQVDSTYLEKVANTDKMLKENVWKSFNSKALADTLSVSVVNIVAPSLEKCYRDIITSTLIPSWERVCGQMFQQINETFTRGTKEYTASVEAYMDKQRRVQDKGKDLIVQMQAVSDTMKINSDKMTTTVSSEIQKQFSLVFKSMQDKLISNMKEVVSEQVKQGFKSHATVIEDSVMNAVRSRAVTPSPHVDSHAVTLSQIQQNLSRGNFDEAFQMALSAENLGFVIYVCERVDIQTLFGEDCILQQSCILALIQQLSVELSKHTDLKLSYIRAAFLSLSPDCTSTKQFIPKVLKDLLKNLNIFIQSHPPLKHLKEAKLLKMAVESMLVK